MEKGRDIDMANVSESMSDLGDKTAGAPGGNIQGGSGGAQGHPDQSDPKEAQSAPHEESNLGGRHETDRE
ncbi:MAG TPA: hypothetical protein VKC34_00260 [Blastocatellia bacterium]|nr:hypothetical protein [Blastocatellia bacterium]